MLTIPPISLFPPPPPSSYEDANSVVTIGDGKFYSLGLDLEHMATMAPYELITFTSDLQKLLARLLTFPLVTVAAINGIYSFSRSIVPSRVHDDIHKIVFVQGTSMLEGCS